MFPASSSLSPVSLPSLSLSPLLPLPRLAPLPFSLSLSVSLSSSRSRFHMPPSPCLSPSLYPLCIFLSLSLHLSLPLPPSLLHSFYFSVIYFSLFHYFLFFIFFHPSLCKLCGPLLTREPRVWDPWLTVGGLKTKKTFKAKLLLMYCKLFVFVLFVFVYRTVHGRIIKYCTTRCQQMAIKTQIKKRDSSCAFLQFLTLY